MTRFNGPQHAAGGQQLMQQKHLYTEIFHSRCAGVFALSRGYLTIIFTTSVPTNDDLSSRQGALRVSTRSTLQLIITSDILISFFP